MHDEHDFECVLRAPVLRSHMYEVTDVLALDCEFVGGMSNQSLLGRVSVVNLYGHAIYDFYVDPDQPVRHYRTRYSGISARVLERARRAGRTVSASAARTQILEYASRATLVGHALANDFRVLGIDRSKVQTIDTQQLARYVGDGLSKGPALRKVVYKYFNLEIQASRAGHSSVEDAQSSMLIYRTFRPEFERERALHK